MLISKNNYIYAKNLFSAHTKKNAKFASNKTSVYFIENPYMAQFFVFDAFFIANMIFNYNNHHMCIIFYYISYTF